MYTTQYSIEIHVQMYDNVCLDCYARFQIKSTGTEKETEQKKKNFSFVRRLIKERKNLWTTTTIIAKI